MHIHSVDDRILIDCTIAEYGGLIAAARDLYEISTPAPGPRIPVPDSIRRPIGDLLAANAEWELPAFAGCSGVAPAGSRSPVPGSRIPHPRVPPARCRTNADEVRMINAELADIQSELIGRTHTARIASELVPQR